MPLNFLASPMYYYPPCKNYPPHNPSSQLSPRLPQTSLHHHPQAVLPVLPVASSIASMVVAALQSHCDPFSLFFAEQIQRFRERNRGLCMRSRLLHLLMRVEVHCLGV